MNNEILPYKIIGKGQPVVFIHGFLEDNQMWNNLLPHLDGIQAILIGLPGHGNSPLLNEPLTLPSIAQAFVNTLDEIKIKNFSIIGHSMGGYVTLHIAELIPERVEQLVLFHSHPWADSAEKKINRTRGAEIVQKHKEFYVREAITELYAPENRIRLAEELNYTVEIAEQITPESIAQNLIAMRDRENKVSVLKQFENRAHIIHGEFDPLINTEEITRITQENKNQLYFIKGIGHIGYNEAPEQVVKILMNIFS